MKTNSSKEVYVLGAGYSGLTTAVELAIRGYTVRIVAQSLGYMPPLTIVGTQSRRWPGSAMSNQLHDFEDLLDRETKTLRRLVALTGDSKRTGVSVVPALKVSRKENNTWNHRRVNDIKRLKAAAEVQRSLRLVADPSNVDQESIDKFYKEGYKTVDETQVVKIDTAKYFRYLIDIVIQKGGSLDLGTILTKDDVNELMKKGHVVNCLAGSAKSIANAKGEYYTNYGEVLMMKECPRDFGFYVMDDDVSAGVMQAEDGTLYLSTAAPPGPFQTQNTIKDCDGVCRALFGKTLCTDGKIPSGYESWKTDRPMRKEGFNIGAEVMGDSGNVMVQNSGHGGAGVAASWACATEATDALSDILNKDKAW